MSIFLKLLKKYKWKYFHDFKNNKKLLAMYIIYGAQKNIWLIL